MKLRIFINAARLRTLPLSVSGIVMGGALAYRQGYFQISIFLWALLTTILFQVLSNFANDYGDGVKGTDNKNRIGPERALQSGKISQQEMKKAIIITSLLSAISTIILIYVSFGKEDLFYILLFLLLGGLSIVAAIKYTIGNSAYGYRGFGDIFVFVFFGLVSVVGSFFLYAHHIHWKAFLPASAIGLLSVAVLNLNNMRDVENDKLMGKNTLVVKMGSDLAKYYHYYLIVLAMLAMLAFSILNFQVRWQLLYILIFIPLAKHLWFVKKNKEPRKLDKELKIVALCTFFLSTLFFIGQIL